jgi:hypothetical protein
VRWLLASWGGVAPLVGLVERLRAEVTELQGRWEALGEELEAKRRRLRLAEATVELMQRRQEEAGSIAGGGGSGRGGGCVPRMRRHVSQAAQASVGCQMSPSEARHVQDCDVIVLCLGQAPAGSSAGGKRPHPPAPGDHRRGGPAPQPRHGAAAECVARAPQAVAVRQGGGAAEGGVQGAEGAGEGVAHASGRGTALGSDGEDLEAALTCFPATESLTIMIDEPLAPAEESRLVELLRGHGGRSSAWRRVGGGRGRLLSSAVRAGALPNLTYFEFPSQGPHPPADPVGWHAAASRGGGRDDHPDDEEQLAALEHLRRLPHLRRLSLTCARPLEAAFPPFIPPSLKTLTSHIDADRPLESLLRELPSMLQASGASLEEIEIEDVPLTGALRRGWCCACSSPPHMLVHAQDREAGGRDGGALSAPRASASWCRAS